VTVEDCARHGDEITIIMHHKTTIDVTAERLAAEAYSGDYRSQATRRAYATDWRAWKAWCDARGYVALPAEPAVLAMYIPHMAMTMKSSSISRRMAAIAYEHALQCPNISSPVHHKMVKDVLKGVRRKIGVAQHGVDALTIERLHAAVAPLGAIIVDVRDRAVLLLQFGAALRRSELCALNVGDATFVDEGAWVLIRRSKTDQDGQGALVGVPFGLNPDTCPVRSLQAWIATLKNAGAGDPLFVTLHGPGQGVIRLRTQAVATIIKRRTAAAGISGKFSGHSPRVGYVTTCVEMNVPYSQILDQTRHKGGLNSVTVYHRRDMRELDAKIVTMRSLHNQSLI
jgi:integrase